ncbi:hypothetical protein KEM54_005328 [Ascosphaera aggregata]|nr:hypothetical protein KEM54_005328 [Ascosphaera aggregata]
MHAIGYRQIGQLFMVGFEGTSVTPQIRSLIEEYHIGCVMLAAKNLRSAEQATRLILELQTIARHAGHVAPLLIALDQENGGVSSLYDEDYIQQYPSAMGIAATKSKTLAREVAHATAQELCAVGVNMILGPVLDVLNNLQSQPLGVRSIGNDAREVSAFGVEFIQGYHDAGLAACGKHFPSYGNLEFLESQGDVPVISQSVSQLSMSALLPFRTSVTHGIDAMMVGGCVIPDSGTSGTHACLSETVVDGLLRRDLRFDGVVVSDCLEMESLIHAIGVSSGTVMSVKAGCDIILLCRSYTTQQEAIHGLKVGVENGIISKERIRQSFGRILDLKTRCTSWDKALNPPGLNLLTIIRPSHLSLSKKAYNSSVTVVKDRDNLLPLLKAVDHDEPLLLLTPHLKPLAASAAKVCSRDTNGVTVMSKDQISWQRSTTEPGGEGVFREFGRTLTRARNGRVMHATYTSTGVSVTHENLIERCGSVIIVTANAKQHRYQCSFAKFVSLLCKRQHIGNSRNRSSKPVIVISVSSPFDFAEDDRFIDTHICSYDFTERALDAVVRILYGKLTPIGSLPGSVSKTQKTNPSRQHWLVENWNEKRDAGALDKLLDSVRENSPSSQCSELAGVTHNTFMLRSPDVDEYHFVVRNSSTRDLYGFCSTYVFKSSGTGAIGAILVDPGRRRMSIAHSLHSRSIRTLLQRSDVRQFQLGSRLPGIYLGIPLGDQTEARRLRSWFSDMGWDFSKSHNVCTMILRNLTDWMPPSNSTTISSDEVDYDFIYEAAQGVSILEHVRSCLRPGFNEIYAIALNAGSVNSGVIRAKRRQDGLILGTVVVYSSQSKLAQLTPAIKETRDNAGGASALVISPVVEEFETLARSLIMHSTKMIKQLGGNAMVLDLHYIVRLLLDHGIFGSSQLRRGHIRRFVMEFDAVLNEGLKQRIQVPASHMYALRMSRYDRELVG